MTKVNEFSAGACARRRPWRIVRASLLAMPIAMLALGGPAIAHDGHDHDEKPAALQSGTHPRFEAASERFELVATVEAPGQLTIHLDRRATNEPVVDARIEVETAGHAGAIGSTETGGASAAAPQPDGTYAVRLAALQPSGRVDLRVAVSADGTTERLVGALMIGDPMGNAPGRARGDTQAHGDEHAEPGADRWLRPAAFLAAGVVVALLVLVIARRWPRRRRMPS